MRIGFDARAIRYRGIGTYSRNLLRCFVGTSAEFVVFCQDQVKDTIPSSDSFTLVSANMDPLSPRGKRAFRALVGGSKVDLLHVPSPWAPTPLSVPLIATVHDVTPLLYPRSMSPTMLARYKRQLDQTIKEAVKVITVSRISHSTLSVYAGVDPGKVQVIPNGVAEYFRPESNPDTLRSIRRRYSLPERFIFWAGDFRPEKNVDLLIRAWPRLKERLPDLPPLVLAGAQEGLFRKLKAEAAKRGLESDITFPGFISDADLPAVYSAATVFVFPSLYEGFGLPPLEAMACGTPCVVSNSSSLPEVTGSAALMFNPTSVESLEECMVRVLEDHELYASLREEGLRRSARFSWASAAEETFHVYQDALATNPRRRRPGS